MSNLKNKGGLLNSRAALFAALFAFAVSQILIGAHSAKYGDDPHEHFGQACVLALAAPAGDKFVSAASFVFAALVSTWVIATQSKQMERARIRVRAARPRGPPSL